MANEGRVELQATVDAESAKNSFEQLESALKQVAKLAQNTDVDVNVDTTEARKTLDALGKQLDDIDKQDVDADVDTEAAQKNLGGLKRAADTATKAIKAFVAAFVVRELLGFGKAVLAAAVEVETLQLRLEGLGETDAPARINELRQIADDLGLNFENLAERAVDFESALVKSGFEAGVARDIFTSMSVALKGAGADTQRVTQAFTALTQVASKGKISMEEIRQQLAEAIPGAVNIVAKSLGLTVEQFEDMAASGELVGKEVLPALAIGFEKAFSESVTAQIESAATSLEQVSNQFREIAERIGTEALPALKKILDLIDDLTENEALIKSITDAIGDMAGALSTMADIAGALRNRNLTEIFARLTVVVIAFVQSLEEMLSGPVRKLLAVFGLEIPEALDFSRRGLETARREWQRLAEGAKDSGDKVNKTLDETVKRTENLTAAQKDAAEQARRDAAIKIAAARDASAAQIEAANAALQAILKADKQTLDSAVELAAERLRIAKAGVAKLPEAEREAANLRIRELQRLLAKTKELAEEGSLAQIKEINAVTIAEVEGVKARQEALEGLSATLAGLAAAQASAGGGTIQGPRVEGGGGGGDVSEFIPPGLRDEIAALEADLERLNEAGLSLFEGSFAQTQMEDRLQRLREQARQTATQVRDSFGEIQDAPANISEQFLASVDAIIAAIQLLPAGMQGPVSVVLASLAELAESGTLTSEDLAGSAGVIQSVLTSAMGASGAAATDASQRILAVGAATSTAASEAASSASQFITLDGSLEQVEIAARDAEDQIIKFGDETIKVGEQAGQASGGTIKFGDEIIEVAGAADAAAVAAGDAANRIGDVEQPATQAGAALGPLAAGLDATTTAFTPLVPLLQSAAPPFTSIADDLARMNEAGSASETIAGVGQALTENQEAITATAPPLTTIGEAVAVVNENAGAATVVTDIGTAVTGLVENEALTAGAEGFDGLAQALTAITTAAEPAGVALGTVGTGGEAAAAGLKATKDASADVISEALVKDVDAAAGAIQNLGATLSTTNPLVDTLGIGLDDSQSGALQLSENIAKASTELGAPLSSAVTSATGALDRLDKELAETKEQAGETVDEVKRFDTDGVPAISALNAELEKTKQNLRDIARLAAEALEAINAVNAAGG